MLEFHLGKRMYIIKKFLKRETFHPKHTPYTIW
jgi:hypothetical protein